MTLPLLKTALEPIARRQRTLRLMLWLALSWLALAVIGFGLWNAGVKGPGVVTALAFAGVIVWVVLRRMVAAWEPDYVAIARNVERLHPDLHALLLTAVEQRPEDASGKLNFLQQRVVVHAVGEVRRRNCIDTVPGWQMAGATALQFATLALAGLAMFGLMKAPEKSAPLVAAKTGEDVAVTPGDVEIERGSGLVVLAKFERNVPSEAVLVLSPADAPAKRFPLVKNLDDPVFGGGIPEVQTDASYRVEYTGRATRDFRVKVFEHPRLDRADARIKYPEFAKLPEKLIADTRRVSAVQGATLNVEFQLNKPVKSASLMSKDGSTVQLVVDPAKSVAELRDFPVRESQAWELKLQDADGRANKLATSFTLDALPNRRPQLKVITPKGDQRVSPIEEVAFRAEVWDDFGLAAAGIKYTIAGGRTEEVPLVRDSKPDERLNLEHVLKLEDIGVKVDELVSWHLWADDVGPDGKPRRTESDMYFAEVRPFEEIYRPGDESAGGQQQGGGAGGEATKLAELQKQIISATWNLKRAEDNNPGPSGPGEKYQKDEPIVKDSQAEALGMATKLAEKIEDPKSKGLIDNVTQEMDRALEHLVAAEKTTAPLPDALAAEQASYNALLKLAAHEFRVMRNQRQQGKGKGQQGDKNRAQLDELEMKDEKKRYETQSEAQAPQNEQQKEQLAVLNRLKELAQRQQDINERVKELQTALQEARTEKEREEAKRQLKRLREEEQQLLADLDELRQKLDKEQNQSRFADERKQLEQTRNDAQQAAESMQKGESSRALAEGKRAEQGLQKMRDELRKRTSGQFKNEMRQMRTDARDLAQRQQEIADQLDAKPQGKERRTLDGSSPREKLSQDFQKQQEGLENLRQQMQGVSEQAEVAEPLLARQLYDTLRENTQAGTTDTLAKAGELARRGYGQQVKPFEEKVRGEVEKVKTGVERAAESVLGDEAEALKQARAELDALGRQVEREIANARPDLAANTENKGRDGQQGQSESEKGQQGESQKGDGEKDDGLKAEAQKGEEQKGDGQKGEGQKGDGQKGDGQKGEGQKGDGQKGEGQKGDGQKGDGQKGEGQKGDGQKGEGQKGDGQKGDGQKGDGQKGDGQKGEGQKGDGQKGDGQKGDGQKGDGQRGDGQKGDGQKGDGQKGQGQGGEGSKTAGGAPQDSKAGSETAGSPSSGAGRGTSGQQASASEPRGERTTDADGKATRSRLAELTGAPQQKGGIRTGGRDGGGMGGGATDGEQAGPITGDGFVEWSDRLRNVEEMLDSPELRREAAQIREAAKLMRAEFKRHSEQPKWDIVKIQVGKPLTELRDRVGEELARRESKEALVPIDRDPVPTKYSDRVRRYYEELGRSR